MGSIVLHFTLVITCFQFDSFFCIITKISDYYKHLRVAVTMLFILPTKNINIVYKFLEILL